MSGDAIGNTCMYVHRIITVCICTCVTHAMHHARTRLPGYVHQLAPSIWLPALVKSNGYCNGWHICTVLRTIYPCGCAV